MHVGWWHSQPSERVSEFWFRPDFLGGLRLSIVEMTCFQRGKRFLAALRGFHVAQGVEQTYLMRGVTPSLPLWEGRQWMCKA